MEYILAYLLLIKRILLVTRKIADIFPKNYYKLTEISIVSIICLILILFFSLIFNEIIELNFLGLSQNTRKNIINRANTEVEGALFVKNEALEGNYETQKDGKEIEMES